MGRFFLLVLAAIVLWTLLVAAVARLATGSARRRPALGWVLLARLLGLPGAPGAAAGGPADRGTLVRCAGCGTHVPRERALTAGGAAAELYCSPRCRDAAVTISAAR